MLFYFVRHGETEANRQHLLAGSGIDHELNEQGHRQAQELAGNIRHHIGQPIHRVLVSNMIRTKQTGSYLAENLALPMEIMPEWREWHLGEWEGKPYADYGHLILGDGEPPQGESRKIFYGRIEQAWKSIHSPANPYIIVSHGAVWLAMQDLLHIPRFKIENCQLVKIQSRAGRWFAEAITS